MTGGSSRRPKLQLSETSNSVYNEMVSGALPDAAAAPDAAEDRSESPAQQDPTPLPAPRRAPQQRPGRRPGNARRPDRGMPQHVAAMEATTPLQVKIPVTLHWDLKQAAAWSRRTGGMTRAVTALITAYTHDPELIDSLIDRAESAGVPFGELVHDALMGVDS